MILKSAAKWMMPLGPSRFGHAFGRACYGSALSPGSGIGAMFGCHLQIGWTVKTTSLNMPSILPVGLLFT